MIIHNSFLENFRKPVGAAEKNHKIEFHLLTDEGYDKVTFRLWTIKDAEQLYEMGKTEGGFHISLAFDEPGTYWYFFILTKSSKVSYYCCKEGFTGGEGFLCLDPRASFQITVYDPSIKVPHWLLGGIMYQIFPDRFCRKEPMGSYTGARNIHYNWNEKPNYLDTGSSNYDFFGGNLRGVIDKLDYLKQLGVNVIYFNPIFQSASNHRYDTGDYLMVDSMFGSEKDLEELITKGKENGIAVVLDGVFNHTGSDSRYFNKFGSYDEIGAFQSKESRYFSWYKFMNHPHDYESWWGIDTLPNINEDEPAFQRFIYGNEASVVTKWMQLGIKGWRLDVADELPDDFLEGFYRRVKELDPEAVVIGEVWEDASNKRSYGKMRKYVGGKQFDSIMNYPLRKLIIEFLAYGNNEEGGGHREIDGEEFKWKLMNLQHNYPKPIFYGLMNFLSTHDTNRILTLFSDSPYDKSLSKKEQCNFIPEPQKLELGIKRLRIAWAFMIAMPGMPCIYYGDETGMFGYKDPFNRGTYPWGSENQELIGFFSRLNQYRRDRRSLTEGDLEIIYGKGDIVGIRRCLKRDEVLFFMNRSRNKSTSVSIPSRYSFMDVESGEVFTPDSKHQLVVDMKVLSYRILQRR